MRKYLYLSLIGLCGIVLVWNGYPWADKPPAAAAQSDDGKPADDATPETKDAGAEGKTAAADNEITAKRPAKSQEPTPSAEAQASASKRFTPPFPNRVDLFEPPKRDESTKHRGDTTEELVELKGFVNVDEPRVVLSIDGVIAPLPEGGQKYGVQVISIKPPSVVLQRGRSRWTATLE